jgi:hypothetical protein
MKKAFANKRSVAISLPFLGLAVCLTALVASQANGQIQPEPQKTGPTMILPETAAGSGLGISRMHCAGYFRLPPLKGIPQIVGGEDEQEKHIYTTGDYVYIDSGSRKGLREGQEFHILRPRGDEMHVFRQKKGNLGVFFQEIGQLQVIRVKDEISVAQITFSCDGVFLGDLLTGVPDRTSPQMESGISFDRFGDSTGKPTGRVMMAKDGHETVAAGDTIYIDIGDEDRAVLGDTVTIYRAAGTGNLNVKTYDLARNSEQAFASEHYRGGGLSIQAPRAKDRKGEEGLFRQSPIKTSDIKSSRPPMPRKVVGEAVIINVQVRTATAVITRVLQEVHTGDYVELR